MGIASQVKGAHSMLVPGVNHLWNLEQPDLFNQTVRAWISGTALPSEFKPL